MRQFQPLLLATILALSLIFSPLTARAADATTAPASPPGFDPARHMRVSEVKIGMKGYGLSVFKGTKIERFEVEVLSVLKNFNPKCDVILIKCSGANLEHTGSIAGMSGSPVYLKDEQGKERMIGAFAYGWPLMKDPVAGVQPIEYMLAIPEKKPATQPSAAAPARGSDVAMLDRPRWSLDDIKPFLPTHSAQTVLAGTSFKQRVTFSGADDMPRLAPLATPLMSSGISAETLDQFAPLFKSLNLIAVQGGGIAGGGAAEDVDPKMEPGAVLAVPLLTGDMELTAIGTCTEVLGNRVLGFGHAFNNEGLIALPMGSGYVNAIIANLNTSFKLGALSKTSGTLRIDDITGVGGSLGELPPMVPIDFEVKSIDTGKTKNYHFDAASHPRFTPLLAALAMEASFGGSQDTPRQLPAYHTLDYAITVEFANGQKIEIANRSVNSGPMGLFSEFGTPMIAAAENPFEKVLVKKISGTITVTPEAREAHILSVNLPRLKYHPGETIKAFVTYRPFRQGEALLPVEMEIPRDLPEGTYQLTVSDSQTYLQDEQQSKPFRFTAESTQDLFTGLKELAAIRHNAVYLRLLRQADGVAIGRRAMPHLPSSRREVLISAGRSNTTPFITSTVKIVPTEDVMAGSAQFAITVDKDAKVEVGGPRPPTPP
ncbi:MAG TPA: hypothetical protein VIL86_12870, partial [Tepidisphaeraceae bacterium]